MLLYDGSRTAWSRPTVEDPGNGCYLAEGAKEQCRGIVMKEEKVHGEQEWQIRRAGGDPSLASSIRCVAITPLGWLRRQGWPSDSTTKEM